MSAAWHPDPTGRHELRYHDGTTWTDHVSDGGNQSMAPMGPRAESPAPAAAPGAPGAPGAPSGVAGISGDLVDGRFAERGGVGAELQNSRLLRVRVTEPFMARQGSMVAYQGEVTFAFQGGGAARFLKKALTGEGLAHASRGPR